MKRATKRKRIFKGEMGRFESEVGTVPIDRVAESRTDVVAKRRAHNAALRAIGVDELVPKEVREHYAFRWQQDQIELERIEYEETQRRFGARMRRLWHRIADAVLGKPPPFEPKPQHFEG